MQRRLSETTVGPSTLRGQGAGGMIAAARMHLYTLNLACFADPDTFGHQLDLETAALLRRFPKGGKSWGGARKVLNLFLREVLYNRFIFEAYDFRSVESLMEVPLDNHVALRLRKEPEGQRLARWPRLIRLTPQVSDQYQEVALAVAERRKLARVHLDLIYWRNADA